MEYYVPYGEAEPELPVPLDTLNKFIGQGIELRRTPEALLLTLPWPLALGRGMMQPLVLTVTAAAGEILIRDGGAALAALYKKDPRPAVYGERLSRLLLLIGNVSFISGRELAVAFMPGGGDMLRYNILGALARLLRAVTLVSCLDMLPHLAEVGTLAAKYGLPRISFKKTSPDAALLDAAESVLSSLYSARDAYGTARIFTGTYFDGEGLDLIFEVPKTRQTLIYASDVLHDYVSYDICYAEYEDRIRHIAHHFGCRIGNERRLEISFCRNDMPLAAAIARMHAAALTISSLERIIALVP